MAESPTRSYDHEFYAEGSQHALRSARRIVPFVLDLLPVHSVVDVGCGVGSWLSVFAEHGVPDVLGIDGAHVDRTSLAIPQDRFLARDLTQGLQLARRFDLAMSVEVAEHLPRTAAGDFVSGLCALAPVVLFSAAVPSQGGVHHVNEQWPDYWNNLFSARGFACVDPVRPRFWNDPDVSWWYAQNILLFVERSQLARYPALADRVESTPRRLAHSELVDRNEHRKRLLEGLVEILEHVPAGARALVADDGQLLDRGRRVARDFTWLPFLARDGEFWGAPADAAVAIEELEHARTDGADHLVVCWPALWWLQHFTDFKAHLDSRYRRRHASDHTVIYDLSGDADD